MEIIDEKQEAINAAYVWVEECQANLAEIADRRHPSENDAFEHIEYVYRRYEMAVRKHEQLVIISQQEE